MTGRVRLPEAVPALYPLPVVLVGAGDGRQSNIMTAAWVGVMSSQPPVIGVGIRPDRHTHHLVTESGEFTVNVPDVDMLEALRFAGRRSGRDTDKFGELGLSAEPPGVLRCAPLVAECPISLECRVRHTLSLGSHDLFLGEVMAVWADRGCLSDEGIDPTRLKLVSFARGRYFGPGDELLPSPKGDS